MTILHLDASITGENSASRAISRSIVDQLKSGNDSEVIYRDLTADPLPHLTLTQRMKRPKKRKTMMLTRRRTKLMQLPHIQTPTWTASICLDSWTNLQVTTEPRRADRHPQHLSSPPTTTNVHPPHPLSPPK